ncbi:MAG TPA: sigma-70 family RNA polymerase sigma factor, partial [Vicinamibacteria bacterium]|nr:sigma-70 family RNA polymerase sigma factor [Vicinamibacteria bacterium]
TGVEGHIATMVVHRASTPSTRGRLAALNLDDLFLFVTAASAALPAGMAVAVAEARAAAVEPPAAVEVVAERPIVAVPGAHARFAQLLEGYDRLIRGIVGRVGRRLGFTRENFLTREDIEQEVRLDLWKQVARGQQIDFPATYIYKATLRETLRALRRHSAREMVSMDSTHATDQLLDPVDPFHALAAKEQFREIILAVRCLAPDRQSAVRAHLTGFGFHEIMGLYGWSYQRTRNLISRGMADLRRSLNDKGEAPEEARRALARRTLRAAVLLAEIPRRMALAR